MSWKMYMYEALIFVHACYLGTDLDQFEDNFS